MRTLQKESTTAESVLTLPKDGRALCIGATGTGKSTLVEVLMYRYLDAYPGAMVLVCDTKKRFRTEWQLNGLSAKGLYSGLDPEKGTYLPASYVLPIGSWVDEKWALTMAYRNTSIAVVQTNRLEEWGAVLAYARVFYEQFSARRPRLIIPDELSDFFEVQKQGGIFWQIARTGREMNCALIGGVQRPRYLPRTVFTESSRMYLFRLDTHEDMKTMHDGGIPKNVQAPQKKHAFFYWDKEYREEYPSNREYVLRLEK